MGDLLIRDVPESLKHDLTELARRSGRSLSDETKRILQKGLTLDEQVPEAVDTYDQFRHEFTGALLSDDEHHEMMAAIDAWKQESASAKAAAAE